MQKYLTMKYTQAVENFANNLPADWKLSYSGLKVSPFSASAEIFSPALSRKDKEVLRAESLSISNIKEDGKKLTAAHFDWKKLNFSPLGLDLKSADPSTTAMVSGDMKFGYSFDQASNSYIINDFSLLVPDQNGELRFAQGRLENLVLADGKPMSFDFSIEDAVSKSDGARLQSLDGKTTADQLRFSSKFSYAHDAAANSYQLRNFTLTMLDFNETVSFALAGIQTRMQGDVPTAFRLDISGLDIPLLTTVDSYWREFGYSRLRMDTSLGYNFDAESKITAAFLNLALADMLQTQIQTHLVDVDFERLANPDAESLSAMPSPKIKALQLSYKDASFLRKSLELGAKNAQMPLDAYIQEISAMIDREFIPDPKQADPAMVDASGKIKAYLQSLGQLTIAVNPQQPFGIGDFMAGLLFDRNKLLRALGLTVTVS